MSGTKGNVTPKQRYDRFPSAAGTSMWLLLLSMPGSSVDFQGFTGIQTNIQGIFFIYQLDVRNWKLRK